jgi:membrane-anchored protein YejM (alkaline phosphatase superfamily)
MPGARRCSFQRLADDGYRTAVYLPNLFATEVDDRMFREFGLTKLFIADRAAPSATATRGAERAQQLTAELSRAPYFPAERSAELRRRLTNDLHALEEMKQDIRASLQDGRKFAYLILPQIGHGPWLPIADSNTRRQHGYALMQLQARWLRELVQMLQESDALQDTVIVLTADHGVRTSVEDPAFEPGMISSYSFQVPFALYSAAAFGPREVIETATSHIDIEPTLSALLGVREDTGFAQGVPLWARPQDRRVYFFAERFGGANGFSQSGDYFMSNLVADTQFRSQSMAFAAPALTDSKQREFVKTALSQMKDVHLEIVKSLD